MHQPPFNLEHSYVQLQPDGRARTWDAQAFWKAVAGDDLPATTGGFGTLVGVFAYTADWDVWEMHPAGDEIVHLLEGAATLLLEEADGTREVPLGPGETAIVPRGVWHSARIHQPGRALHVTPGEGTEHRPA